jgi:hypothetical protein
MFQVMGDLSPEEINVGIFPLFARAFSFFVELFWCLYGVWNFQKGDVPLFLEETTFFLSF